MGEAAMVEGDHMGSCAATNRRCSHYVDIGSQAECNFAAPPLLVRLHETLIFLYILMFAYIITFLRDFSQEKANLFCYFIYPHSI